MKILLAACNAKYIHSNLAVYDLQAYASDYADHIVLKEYTINQQKDDIMRDIYLEHPDVVCVSCYIWNLSFVKELMADLIKILPAKVTVADLTSNKYLCDLVTVENANIISETSGTYTNQYLTNGTDKVMIYDKFKTKTDITDGEGFDVTGIFVTAKLSGNIIKEFAPISAPVPTGINNITTEATEANAPAYNLAGQKVGKEYKGVVIKAGKKFIQK